MALNIASSDNKGLLKKACDGEEIISSHSGKEYSSSSSSCEKLTLDSVSHYIAKYDNSVDDNGILSP